MVQAVVIQVVHQTIQVVLYHPNGNTDCEPEPGLHDVSKVGRLAG